MKWYLTTFRKEKEVVLFYLPEKAAHILGGAGV
jgi:hypothetical protein